MNRFDQLQPDENVLHTPLPNSDSSRPNYGKKKAVSPLEEENQVKRQREQIENKQINLSPQSDPPSINDDVSKTFSSQNLSMALSANHTYNSGACTISDGPILMSQQGVNQSRGTVDHEMTSDD